MAIRAGLDVYQGDAVAIFMADASDDPRDLVRYHRLLEEGWDCAFGSRFMPGGRIYDYPRLKYLFNRLANTFIRILFRHRYNDTTNAFKAYRREVIDTVQPLLSKHFNLTVELPLKAIIRGHSYAVVPNCWTNRTSRRGEAGDERDGQPLPLHRSLRLARVDALAAATTGSANRRNGRSSAVGRRTWMPRRRAPRSRPSRTEPQPSPRTRRGAVQTCQASAAEKPNIATRATASFNPQLPPSTALPVASAGTRAMTRSSTARRERIARASRERRKGNPA